jgi:biotin carboxylase
VLGGIAVKVVYSDGETGPASVINLSGDQRMLEAGAKIIAALGVTGLVGFDFVIEAGTGKPLLLEMNARTTPIAHLQPGPGRDLVAPLISRLVGKPVSAATVIGETVALYPQALFVTDDYAHLEGAYLDVPLEDPLLARLMMRRPPLDRHAIAEFFELMGLKVVGKWLRR